MLVNFFSSELGMFAFFEKMSVFELVTSIKNKILNFISNYKKNIRNNKKDIKPFL